ncbi:MAG: YncE family protein [Gemmatimonadales bacterium]
MNHSRVIFSLIVIALLTAGCADTNAPAPEPTEALLAVNSTANTLSIVPVDNPSAAVQVPLGGTTPTPTGVSAFGRTAIVPLGLDNAVAVVDLVSASLTRTIPLPANSGATGSAIVDDSIAYVANPNLNSVSRINYLTGTTTESGVGIYPQGIVYARGRLFVLNGNLVNFAPAGPSWLTVLDPATTTNLDSIPLTGPGNAGFGVLGGDGLLYVMNTGSFFEGEGRLSIVDPVGLQEMASFTGFGTGPGNVAADGGSKIYISSFAEGVMEFDTDANQVVRGAGNGVKIPSNSAVAVDSKGRIYAIESGPCQGGQPGKAHVLDSLLVEKSVITLGECPSGATTIQIPAE